MIYQGIILNSLKLLTIICFIFARTITNRTTVPLYARGFIIVPYSHRTTFLRPFIFSIDQIIKDSSYFQMVSISKNKLTVLIF